MDSSIKITNETSNTPIHPTRFLYNSSVPTIKFDDLDNKPLALANLSDCKNFPFHLQDLNTSFTGRESLGLLPTDILNRSALECGRESLDILQLTKRNSLGPNVSNLSERESLGCGRESLGILVIKSPDVSFGTDSNVCLEETNFLNVGFLNPSRLSVASSGSCISKNLSFNSASLGEPSRIFDISSMNSFDSNNLNKGFCNGITSLLMNSQSNDSKYAAASEVARLRIQSLPVTIEEKAEELEQEKNLDVTEERKFWSVGRSKVKKKFERRSFHGVLDFDEDERENSFYDSVFIEGEHLAQKIADGSILNESLEGQIGLLDSTSQPVWPEDFDDEDSQNSNVKVTECTETVFKKIDKMLPPMVNIIVKNSTINSNSNSSGSSDGGRECDGQKKSYSSDGSNRIQNLSDIKSCSKDAKELLQNLSELINSASKSDVQKSEGRSLLHSLADMLCTSHESSRENRDDSGHSSIEEQHVEEHKCFEVLDLRTRSISNSCSSLDQSKKENNVLDLSLKKNEKRLSQSFAGSSPKVKLVPKEKPLGKSFNSVGVNANKNKSSSRTFSGNSVNLSDAPIAGKLRAVGSKAKKGPMKATIPVGDMKKKNSFSTTPVKKTSTSNISNRTSTPLREPKLRPMAASTPTSGMNHFHAKKQLVTSPLARPNKSIGTTSIREKPSMFGSASKSPYIGSVLSRQKSFSSSTAARLKNSEPKMVARRNSVSENKESDKETFQIPAKRSNSLGGDSGIMASVNRIRQNIVSSPYYQMNKAVQNNAKGLGENRPRTLSVSGKISNSISKNQKLGKENKV